MHGHTSRLDQPGSKLESRLKLCRQDRWPDLQTIGPCDRADFAYIKGKTSDEPLTRCRLRIWPQPTSGVKSVTSPAKTAPIAGLSQPAVFTGTPEEVLDGACGAGSTSTTHPPGGTLAGKARAVHAKTCEEDHSLYEWVG